MSKETITMIDYGASNIRSAHKAFEFIGAEIHLTDDPQIVRRAKKLVLPGVGAFGTGMGKIRAKNLDQAINEVVQRGVPLLGICLGMQFLFEESDEMGQHKGLGLLSGLVTRFNFSDHHLKIPHMGWNQISHQENHPLLNLVPSGAHTYFVHSYYCQPKNNENVLAYTNYGGEFASIVGRENIYGIQFHPEKSQNRGLQILHNFVNLI